MAEIPRAVEISENLRYVHIVGIMSIFGWVCHIVRYGQNLQALEYTLVTNKLTKLMAYSAYDLE